MKILKPYIEKKDARGLFSGIINSGTWEEMNIIETDEGGVRGGHYHKTTVELFYILSGRVEVEISGNGREKKIYPVGEGDIFLIDPLEVHTFRCLTKCRWINVLSKKIDPQVPDFYK